MGSWMSLCRWGLLLDEGGGGMGVGGQIGVEVEQDCFVWAWTCHYQKNANYPQHSHPQP